LNSAHFLAHTRYTNTYINIVPIMGIMSFVRKKSRKLASGEVKDYYYEVENKWKDGKVKQKVIRYLGTTPYQNHFDIDREKAQQVSQILFEKDSTPSLVKDKLENIGIPVPSGELTEVHLVFNPPLGSCFIIIK